MADLAAMAAGAAGSAETARRLDSDVVAGVLATGFARHFVPVAHGGAEGSFAGLTGAVATLGEACASTAWFASLTSSLGRMAAFLPGPGQARLWADGPDTLVVGALMPLGRGVPVDGGWRLTGRWSYVSGVDFSDWALVCAMVPGTSAPEARFFATPRATYAVEDTWFNVGMRATGSNTLVLDDVFVPSVMSFTRDAVVGGRPASPAPYDAPLKAVNGLSFASPILGAARGALAVWSGYVWGKVSAEPSRRSLSGTPGSVFDLTLARAAGEIDAAELLLARVASVADAGGVTPLLTARSSRDCALAVDLLVTAVDRLFRSAGTSAQSSSGALQRFWRDVHAGASHVVLQPEPAAQAYAALVLAR